MKRLLFLLLLSLVLCQTNTALENSPGIVIQYTNSVSSYGTIEDCLKKYSMMTLHFPLVHEWIIYPDNLGGAYKDLINDLRNLSTVVDIRKEEVIPNIEVLMMPSIEGNTNSNNTTSWNLKAINLNAALDFYNHHKKCHNNVIVANIDTGVRASHIDFKGREFSSYWHDPFLKSASSLIIDDEVGHGTHTLGIMLSITPNAKWSACRGCNYRGCWESAILQCFDYFMNLTSQNPSLRIVLNLSWSMAGQNQTHWLTPVLQKIKAEKQIFPVFSNGNLGNGFGSVGSPADLKDARITVGALADGSRVWKKSSRGPTLVGKVLKPLLVAPGVNILAADSKGDDTYSIMSGTSQAAPHVAGALALLLSVTNNTLSTHDAVELLSGSTSISKNLRKEFHSWPNNAAGHGVLNTLDLLKLGTSRKA